MSTIIKKFNIIYNYKITKIFNNLILLFKN